MFPRSAAPTPEPAAPRTGRRFIGLDAAEWGVVGLGSLIGIGVGLLVHWVDSLATDVAYMADFMRAVAYVVAFVVFMVGVGQLTTGRRWLLLGVIPFAIAAIIASGFGPTAAPSVQVEGTLDLAVDGSPADPGVAVCTWAAGREKVERINNRGTLPTGREYALDVDRGRLRVKLELDGGEYVALGSEAFDTIDGAGQDAGLHLPLLQTLVSAPAGIPAAVNARIDWTCQPAPAS
ncbi:MAG TPA: hypothetical protein VIF44_07800 [Candidatus Limnocylindrales bacterium]